MCYMKFEIVISYSFETNSKSFTPSLLLLLSSLCSWSSLPVSLPSPSPSRPPSSEISQYYYSWNVIIMMNRRIKNIIPLHFQCNRKQRSNPPKFLCINNSTSETSSPDIHLISNYNSWAWLCILINGAKLNLY